MTEGALTAAALAARVAPSRAHRVMAVWYRHFRVYSGTFVSNVAPAILEPILLLLSVGVGLGQFVNVQFNGLPYREFMAAGTLATTALYTASFESTYGTYVRMTFQKTYAAMLATPLSARDCVLGELLFCGSKGFLFTAIVCVVLAALGAVSSWWALLAPFAGFVIALLFAGMGFVVVTLIGNMNQFALYFTTVLTPLVMFSGLMFPVQQLPEPLQVAVYATPMFHAVETMRLLLSGPEHLSTSWSWACPFILCAYAFATATFGMARLERKLRG